MCKFENATSIRWPKRLLKIEKEIKEKLGMTIQYFKMKSFNNYNRSDLPDKVTLHNIL